VLVRHAVASSVIQLLRHDPGVRLGEDPEDVHWFRVATRKLRSELRTFRPLLGDAQMSSLRAELRWLGGKVGPVRDADVLAERLAATLRPCPQQTRRRLTIS
jgi:CHAD domain-containing protein